MQTELIVGMTVILLLFLLFSGMHVGIAMALDGFCGILALRLSAGLPFQRAFTIALGSFANGPISSTAKETLVVIPMFILMGAVCGESGISRELYDACYHFVSRVRGGLAIATVIACSFFSAICGSATATTATMAKICLPEMDKYRYQRAFSCGTIAAGGTLGLMIPPSTGFMLYAVASGVGVGKMFLAGILPGLILALSYCLVISAICRLCGAAGRSGELFTIREKLSSLRGIIPVLLLFFLVLGGILLGWCSASEGGAVGAAGSLLVMLLRGKMNRESLVAVLRETTDTTAMIFLIMIGSDILSQFIGLSNLSASLRSAALASGLGRWMVLLLCLGIFALLGCFMDSLPLICLLTPVFLPIITTLGFDSIWFGVLMVLLMQLGLLTPPVGMCCYVMNGVAKNTTLREIFYGTAPFYLGILFTAIVVMLMPGLAVWLPGFAK